MRLKALLYIAFLLFVSSSISAQKSTHFTVNKKGTSEPRKVKQDFRPILQNLEIPSPDGNSSRDHLMKIKQKSRELYPIKKPTHLKKKSGSAVDTLSKGRGFQGNIFNGGRPNDNTMAISNDGILLSAINTNFYGFDVEADTQIFDMSLMAFFDTLGNPHHKYDPKLIYDPIEDKFILITLAGNKDSTSSILVAFSTTTDPKDDWYLYEIPGNPLNDTSWSDYPAISLTEDELFITINLLHNTGSWRTAFKQSLIWQVDKFSGYDGEDEIDTKLWSDIEYNGARVRNIHAVKGGSGPQGPNAWFLSNKNFAITTDSIFMIQLTGKMDNVATQLNVDLLYSDHYYGVPPFARQANNHTFDSNDARVLGGIVEDDHIQFVNTTIDSSTGLAAVYHGVISDIYGDPEIDGEIISDTHSDTLQDYGYPNIAWTGKDNCDRETIISFNHSSPADFAGNSAIWYTNDGEYSEVKRLKEGNNFVDTDQIPNAYERWGDYTGVQRRYNEGGTVWNAAYYATGNKRNQTWISEIFSPSDTTRLRFRVTNESDIELYGACNGSADLEIYGGVPPYTLTIDDTFAVTTPEQIRNLCPGEYRLTISDSRGCNESKSITLGQPDPPAIATAYPSPSDDLVTVYFNIPATEQVDISLYAMNGKKITDLMSDLPKAGDNLFSFSVRSLPAGIYVLKIQSDSGEILSQKIVRR